MRAGPLRRTLLRAIAVPVVLVMLAGTAAAGPADTKRKIADAKARLKLLESRISAQQARVLELNTALKAHASEVGRSRRLYEALQERLVRTQVRRTETEERYRQLRDQIGLAAAQAYMRGPGYVFEALMDLESLTDVADVLTYTGAITSRNAELADEVSKVAFELDRRAHEEALLLSERQALHTRLTAEQKALTNRFVEQQLQLAELARDRAEAGSLLAQLRRQLRAEEIAAAEEALRNGTPLTFGEWAKVFLKELHAPVARNNLVVMVAWQVAEYTQAKWNPLATTYPMPGATEYNSHGVRNYTSLAQGLEATRRTLQHCCYGYEAILANLARNAESMTTGQAINDSRWCSGCADGGYVIDLIPTVEQYYDDYAGKSA